MCECTNHKENLMCLEEDVLLCKALCFEWSLGVEKVPNKYSPFSCNGRGVGVGGSSFPLTEDDWLLSGSKVVNLSSQTPSDVQVTGRRCYHLVLLKALAEPQTCTLAIQAIFIIIFIIFVIIIPAQVGTNSNTLVC